MILRQPGAFRKTDDRRTSAAPSADSPMTGVARRRKMAESGQQAADSWARKPLASFMNPASSPPPLPTIKKTTIGL
ncbi:MAG TPA: hypothetical protein VH858_11270 [Hyphomicrobiales bacterium]|jgi:hypothetical protein